MADLRAALRAGLEAAWRWDDIVTPNLLDRIIDDMEPVVASGLAAAPEPLSRPRTRYVNEWGEMVPSAKGQWVHVKEFGVKTWDLDPLPPVRATK